VIGARHWAANIALLRSLRSVLLKRCPIAMRTSVRALPKMTPSGKRNSYPFLPVDSRAVSGNGTGPPGVLREMAGVPLEGLQRLAAGGSAGKINAGVLELLPLSAPRLRSAEALRGWTTGNRQQWQLFVLTYSFWKRRDSGDPRNRE